MKLRKPLTALALLAAIAAAGCRSNPSSPAAAPDFPCTCGTPEAAMESCLHPLCVSGEGNPDDPDCVCGKLFFGKEQE